MFPTVTMCTKLRTLRTGSYAPDVSVFASCDVMFEVIYIF